MERSNFANVLVTTRLLQYFNSDNVAVIKSCILAELGCENDKEFLCKILTMIHGSLSNKSTTIIKNKAVEIADLQLPTQKMMIPQHTLTESSSSSNTKDTNDNNHISESLAIPEAKSIYKYVEEKYNDLLSNLNGNVIDHLGSFLTKKESISLGYLNKQLYIETQKLSYLLKRCKDSDEDNPFKLNKNFVSTLLWSMSSAYSYSFPTHLKLGAIYGASLKYSCKKIFKRDFFNNFFLRLNYLKCNWLEMLGYVPINLLFNGKCNFYDSIESRKYIQELNISGSFDDEDINREKIEAGFDRFCQKLDEYKKLNGNNMRKIKRLRFNVEKGSTHDEFGRWGWRARDYDEGWTMPKKLKKLFLSCCSVSHSIYIDCEIDRLGINNINEFKQIFHPNLKSFCFKQGSFTFDSNINDDDDDDEKGESKRQSGMLEEIEMSHGVMQSWQMDWSVDNVSLFNVLNTLDKFEMRRNIKRYIINWKADSQSNERDELLDKLFFQDYKKHPLLKRIVFRIGSSYTLSSVLEYLIENRKELFVTKDIKLKLKCFEAIELEIEGRHADFGGYGYSSMKDRNSKDNFVVNEQFTVDKRVVKINNPGECIEHVERNMTDWYEKVVEANQTIGGRKVVFCV